MTKKPNKYSKRHKISQDIDSIFKNQKGLVLEKGNFAWTHEQLSVAKSKGIRIN